MFKKDWIKLSVDERIAMMSDVVKYYNIELCDEFDIEKEVKRQEKLFWETMKRDFGYDKKKKR